ncbi:hypothetical protein C0991_001803, partial [Blastosporella zonata]
HALTASNLGLERSAVGHTPLVCQGQLTELLMASNLGPERPTKGTSTGCWDPAHREHFFVSTTMPVLFREGFDFPVLLWESSLLDGNGALGTHDDNILCLDNIPCLDNLCLDNLCLDDGVPHQGKDPALTPSPCLPALAAPVQGLPGLSASKATM